MSTVPDERAPARRTHAPADYDHHTVGRVGRSAVLGGLAGSLGIGTVVTLASLAASAEVGQALGIGAAVALTGGPFFGALAGFAIAVRAAEVAASGGGVRPSAEDLRPASA